MYGGAAHPGLKRPSLYWAPPNHEVPGFTRRRVLCSQSTHSYVQTSIPALLKASGTHRDRKAYPPHCSQRTVSASVDSLEAERIPITSRTSLSVPTTSDDNTPSACDVAVT